MDIASIVSAAGAGLLSFFSPCILPLLPVYIGILTTGPSQAGGERADLGLGAQVARTLAFVLGISCVFVGLGIGAATLGNAAASNPYLNVVLGLAIFVCGLFLTGILRIDALQREHRANLSRIKVNGVAGAFLLGLAFSFGWTPCVGPILGSILALAAGEGTVAAGAVLLLAYALGLCVPFVVLTLGASALMSRVRSLYRYLPVIQKVGGALIAAMGLWMVLSQVGALANASKAYDGGDVAQTSEQSAESSQADDDPVVGTVEAGDEDTSTKSSAWKNVVLTDLDGNAHKLSEYKGKPLYFEFWGSWCTSCVQDLGQLTDVYREHEELGDVAVVSVVVPGQFGERSAGDFVQWARDNDVEVPVLMDTNGALSNHLGVSGFPTSVFVTSDSQLYKIRVGAISVDELEGLLSQLS